MHDFCAALTAALLAVSQAPAAPVPPAGLPTPRDPGWGRLIDDRADFPEAPLGAGHLRPAEPPSFAGASWVSEVSLPLYSGPGGELAGWLAGGWILATGEPARPYATDCMVETSYETATIAVAEMREDGWLGFALDAPCDADLVWAHDSLLALGERALVAESWRELFAGHPGPLHFRQPALPHALRAGPGPEHERLTWIGPEHDMTPLEWRGDWLRVRVRQPSGYCLAAEDWEGSVREGWVRWRDALKGPWVWIWSRGC